MEKCKRKDCVSGESGRHACIESISSIFDEFIFDRICCGYIRCAVALYNSEA